MNPIIPEISYKDSGTLSPFASSFNSIVDKTNPNKNINFHYGNFDKISFLNLSEIQFSVPGKYLITYLASIDSTNKSLGFNLIRINDNKILDTNILNENDNSYYISKKLLVDINCEDKLSLRNIDPNNDLTTHYVRIDILFFGKIN